jgi:hypothetical protein
MAEWSRRKAMCAGAAAAGLLAIGGVAGAGGGAKPAMTTYRDPGCDCCGKWADLAKAAGYPVTVIPTRQMAAVKTKLGVPDALASCHTSRVGGYVVEGHVPFAALDKLLRTKPSGVTGIAVPGMPAGSPGMEVHGDHGGQSGAIEVIAFNRAGQRSEFRF